MAVVPLPVDLLVLLPLLTPLMTFLAPRQMPRLLMLPTRPLLPRLVLCLPLAPLPRVALLHHLLVLLLQAVPPLLLFQETCLRASACAPPPLLVELLLRPRPPTALPLTQPASSLTPPSPLFPFPPESHLLLLTERTTRRLLALSHLVPLPVCLPPLLH